MSKSGLGCKLQCCAVEPLEARRLLAAVRILPLGDSITEGYNDPTRISYRFWLWKKLQVAGHDVDFVGTETGVLAGTPIYTDWDQDHQGHSGWTADRIRDEVIGWANSAQPDIVLLHIGTNDMLLGQSVSGTIAEIGQIIDNLRAVNSSVDILLAKIIPSTQANSQIQQLNNQIPPLAATKDNANSRVIVVDQFTDFSASGDNFDGIHPNARGERKMAAKWYDPLVTLLPAPPAPAPPAVTYLSDLNWESATNGSGPVEKDQSVGGSGTDDGGALWLNDITYPKGLGTHAASEIVYNLDGQYARVLATVGIDDNTGSSGSVRFRVLADDVQVYDSGNMTGTTAPKNVDVFVAGALELKLVVTDGGNGNASDHANWAMARLTTQPTVATSSYDFEASAHALAFSFRGDVSGSLSTSDLTLTNLTTDTPVPTESMQLSYNDATDEATFTFPGFSAGTLPDGRYRAVIDAGGITDAAGNPMPANHTYHFFFLTGDADHDAAVDLSDFNVLAANFGLSGLTYSQGDLNYDGTANLSDFNILAGHFGTSIAPQSAALGFSVEREDERRAIEELV